MGAAMKPLNKAEQEHLTQVCNNMHCTLIDAAIVINTVSKEELPEHWQIKKSKDDFVQMERAIDLMAAFVSTFGYAYHWEDYTAIVRFMEKIVHEYDNPEPEDNL
jgi:hypothetical protein